MIDAAIVLLPQRHGAIGYIAFLSFVLAALIYWLASDPSGHEATASAVSALHDKSSDFYLSPGPIFASLVMILVLAIPSALLIGTVCEFVGFHQFKSLTLRSDGIIVRNWFQVKLIAWSSISSFEVEEIAQAESECMTYRIKMFVEHVDTGHRPIRLMSTHDYLLEDKGEPLAAEACAWLNMMRNTASRDWAECLLLEYPRCLRASTIPVRLDQRYGGERIGADPF